MAGSAVQRNCTKSFVRLHFANTQVERPPGGAGAVYAITNAVGGNAVVVYDR